MTKGAPISELQPAIQSALDSGATFEEISAVVSIPVDTLRKHVRAPVEPVKSGVSVAPQMASFVERMAGLALDLADLARVHMGYINPADPLETKEALEVVAVAIEMANKAAAAPLAVAKQTRR